MPYKDPQKARAHEQAYYAKHKEHLKAKRRARNRAKAASIRAYRAAYNAAHREENTRQHAAYCAAHREKINGHARKYRHIHPDRVNAASVKYRAANPEKVAALNRKWRAENPDMVHANHARRRARLAAAPVRDLTPAQWREIKALWDSRCAYCGKKFQRLTMDHIIPLSKGGLHTASNIVPACRSCNSRKRSGPPLRPVQPVLLTLAPKKKDT